MTQVSHFESVLESIESLSIQDQEAIIALISKRLVERRRAEIAANIVKAQQEYQEGKLVRGTVDDLMDELNK